MRLLPHQVAIGIIGDEFEETIVPNPNDAFDGKEGTVAFLRALTGEDYGYDVSGWKAWFGKCDRELLGLLYDDWSRKSIAPR